MAGKVFLALFFTLLFIPLAQNASPKAMEVKETRRTGQRQLSSEVGGETMQMHYLGGLPPITIPPAPAPGPAPVLSPHPLDCGGLCKTRCSLHSRPNLCLRSCGTCCVRCKCVPSGTFGNREMCGKCYTDMLTHGNRLKCP